MVHNSGSSRINGARLKTMGMVPGVSDMIYLKPNGSPIMLEVKNEKGSQSKAQKKWEDVVERAGYEYHLVRSLDEAKKICGWK